MGGRHTVVVRSLPFPSPATRSPTGLPDQVRCSARPTAVLRELSPDGAGAGAEPSVGERALSSTTLLAVLLVAVARPAACGQRFVVSDDDIVATAHSSSVARIPEEPALPKPQKGLGHSSLVWTCGPGQIGSRDGDGTVRCVDRPAQTAEESALARRTLITTNRVVNEFLAEHTSGPITPEATAAAIKFAEQYLEEHGPDIDIDLGWTQREEHAKRTYFSAVHNQLQTRLHAIDEQVKMLQAEVKAVLARSRDLETMLEQSASTVLAR